MNVLLKSRISFYRNKKTHSGIRHITSQILQYNIPKLYTNVFNLANASVHDNVNWYYHNALQTIFGKLVLTVSGIHENLGNHRAQCYVLNSIRMLEQCSNVLKVIVPLERDTGEIELVCGYSVQHGLHQRHLGGLRFFPNLEKSHVTGLATFSTFKHACFDIPYAGSYSGLKINPVDYSVSELDRLLQLFCMEITKHSFHGSNINIFEPVTNCSTEQLPIFVKVFLDTKAPTGIPDINNGLHYTDSIAEGIVMGLENFVNDEVYMKKVNLKKGWTNKTFIVKGFRQIGMQVALHLNQVGAICIGIQDGEDYLYDKNGLDLKDIVRHRSSKGCLSSYNVNLFHKDVLSEHADLLVVSDSFKTLNCYVAPKLDCQIVVEVSNCSITPAAHKNLTARGILVIPDIYTNAAVSLASDLNNSTNSDITGLTTKFIGESVTLDVKKQRDKKIAESMYYAQFKEVAQLLKKVAEVYKLGLDIRTAAYALSIEKLLNQFWLCKPK